jgi:hypothetical protein
MRRLGGLGSGVEAVGDAAEPLGEQVPTGRDGHAGGAGPGDPLGELLTDAVRV